MDKFLKTAALNASVFVVFLFPLLIYATAQDLKLDMVVIGASVGYGILFEKVKAFAKSKIEYFK